MSQQRFRVHRLRDAFTLYATEVEAESADQARQITDNDAYTGRWRKLDVIEYDHTEPGEIERIEDVAPLVERHAIRFDTERRADGLWFRARNRPGAVWHGPYGEVDELIATICHYIGEDLHASFSPTISVVA